MNSAHLKNSPLNHPSEIKPLQVVSFWDGRPGHEQQTRGVVAALARLTAVEEDSRTLPPLSAVDRIRQWLSFLAGQIRQASPESFENAADLIIGTGSATHIPILRLKATCPLARVVTCMTPDFVLRRRVDLCFVPKHDQVIPKENIFETIGPPNNVSFSAAHDPGRGLILIGGLDPKTHFWDAEMLLDQIKVLITRESNRRWTISSSPRTPPETLRRLESLGKGLCKVVCYHSLETPREWIERQYSQNFTVWVTADSVSMVYEALTAGCRVGILPVRWRRKENKLQQGLDFLTSKTYVTPYETWLKEGYASAAGVRLNEASRCAHELLRRWWPNRLP